MRSAKSGFNLIEMSIALVVVAIGILSVAALFPDQLNTVKASMGRSHMNNFVLQAEASIRAMAASSNVTYLAGSARIPLLKNIDGLHDRKAEWSSEWVDAGFTVPGSTGGGTTPTGPVLLADNTPHEIHLIKQVGTTGALASEEYALAYQLQILEVQNAHEVYEVQLRVWPDIWPGRSYSVSDPDVVFFVTEVQLTGSN